MGVQDVLSVENRSLYPSPQKLHIHFISPPPQHQQQRKETCHGQILHVVSKFF